MSEKETPHVFQWQLKKRLYCTLINHNIFEISVRNRLFKRGEKVFTALFYPSEIFDSKTDLTEEDICERFR